ncbi:MAG: hypothetical protein ACK4FM_04600 [Caldimicrobium sp.]
MRRMVFAGIGILFFCQVGQGLATEVCVKCHKSMDIIAERIKASGVKSAEDLVDFLKNRSSKKSLHASLKDEDIKQAFSKVKGSTKAEATPSNKTDEKASKVAIKAKTKKKKAQKQPKKTTNATKTTTTEANKQLQKATEQTQPKVERKAEPLPTKKKVEGC